MALKKIFLLFLTTFLTGAEDSFSKMRNALLKLAPFEVNFRQQLLQNNIREAEESGKIFFVGLQKQRWDYLLPEKKYFLLNSSEYQFYLEADRQLLKDRIGPENENIFELLLNEDRSKLKIRSQKKYIELEIKKSELELKLKIWLDGSDLPAKVEHIQGKNIVTIYEFSNYRSNPQLTTTDLSLQIPEDVEIIEED